MSATIRDVARLAGVSKATASRALSGSGAVSPGTSERVVAAAAEIGYVRSPNAASLVTGRTMSIGVLTPHHDRWFSGAVIEGAERVLLSHDYDMTLYTTRPDTADRERIFTFFLPRSRFDGVLAVATEPSPDEVARLAGLGIPLVAVGGEMPGVAAYGLDDRAIAETATRHLIGLGHTRIAHLGGLLREPYEFSVHRHRREGYLTALAAAGLQGNARLSATEMTIPSGFQAATALLSAPDRPSAIFAASDELAIGAIIAARRLDIAIPGQLSVIGIDGHSQAEMFGLSTVEQYPREQGSDAAHALLGMIGGDRAPAPGYRVARTRLVLRASTGFAPLGDA
ncbi:LacI family DNA-binding transcriptional regulator [Mycetocola reblochoni]|uniref:Transcriptional regulator AglR, LacI family n=2 Tax=Mycetocola reblochoni TaxID=331618 RepID=A0A1R4JXP4_9MICO|nr:LacI family DNA-binding transcriptional regulator [Mycetocola reblochoni]RLP70594.1 LacI family transcriptional regulator [Mycetocola reblochoni]SJN36759.1 Transcriptional regulator AglR, LacI family [Mycetocola reblochoni REB411]